jgi:hypothetical protein
MQSMILRREVITDADRVWPSRRVIAVRVVAVLTLALLGPAIALLSIVLA